MTTHADDLTGACAPPMANGEVLFAEPWQGRVFGMARALADAGLYSWDEFRECLIATLATWSGPAAPGEEFAYYDHFQRALETLLAQKGLVAADALDSLQQDYARRPHGHDH